MPELAQIVALLDTELQIRELPDFPGAHNGLQLENRGTVSRIAYAVDASLGVIQEACNAGADLLLVHHGMFWHGVQPIRNAFYQKLELAIRHGLAIYSAHLPLDIHGELGNNAQLGKALGLVQLVPFFSWKNILIGLKTEQEPAQFSDCQSLTKKLEAIVSGPVQTHAFGPAQPCKIGIITGGAGNDLASVASEGIDTFITGEGAHWTVPLAEELGVNLLYAGHYATETFGVKALALFLAEKFSLPSVFIDRPTGR